MKEERFDFQLGLREDVAIGGFARPDTERVVELAPTKEPTTPLEWVRANLFSSWFNSVVTILSVAFIGFIVSTAFNFVFGTADWAVLPANMKGYMIGRFPIEEAWRIWASAYFVAVLAGLAAGVSRTRFTITWRRVAVGAIVAIIAAAIVLYTVRSFQARLLTFGLPAAVIATLLIGRLLSGRWARRVLLVAWLLAFPVVMVLVLGFGGVSPRLWGGFYFNIIAATVGIVASFPFGILLALGRRSDLLAVRYFCIVFIEIFRGVPLVAWLIFSKFVVDLLLPPQMESPPDIIKSFLAMTAFSAAYVAEIVRGGLQGVPHGQFEAARAVGLSTTSMMALIVLPQALRSTIPSMISHFISLFKDTALFTAIEVTDLLAAAFRSAGSLEFLGTDQEVLVFAALVFWSVAFSMSRWSQRLEVRLGLGER